ncbi:hypothetical protein M8C21_001639, partial [Ambrosia artemisiifolia]
SPIPTIHLPFAGIPLPFTSRTYNIIEHKLQTLSSMKPSLICYLLVISMFLYEAQGLNRKLMTKTIPSTTTFRVNDFISHVQNYENDLKTDLKLTHDRVGREETFQDVIDITRMDYSPAKRKPPIHNLIKNKN